MDLKILLAGFVFFSLLLLGCTGTNNPPLPPAGGEQNQTPPGTIPGQGEPPAVIPGQNQSESQEPPLPPGEEGSKPPEIPEEEQPTLTSDLPNYTIQQMGLHDTNDDCWVYAHGKVYDVTPYIGNHPGGQYEIFSQCAANVTVSFADLKGPGGMPLLDYLDKFYLEGGITGPEEK